MIRLPIQITIPERYFWEDTDIIIKRKGSIVYGIWADSREKIGESDYLNSHIPINKAVDEVAALGGGTIHVKRGEYVVKPSDIGLPYKVAIPIDGYENIRLIGDGEGNTVIKLANNVGGTILYYKNAHWLEIRDITFDGNRANNSDSGIDGDLVGVKGEATFFAKLVNVEFRNFVRQGFYPTSCSWSHYENLYAHDNGLEGIVLDSEDLSTVFNLKTNNNGLIDSSRAGLYVVGGATRATSYVTVVGGIHYNNPINVKVYNAIGVELLGFKAYYSRKDNKLDGVWVQNSQDVRLVSVEAIGNARAGILLIDSENINIIGCLSKNNGQAGIGLERAGIVLTYSSTGVKKVYISDCQLYDDQSTKTQLFAIRVVDPSYIDDVVVERSVLEPNADARLIYQFDPAKMKVINSKGFLTRNYGQATFSGDGTTTQFTIAHGLVTTPNKVRVIPASADAAGDFYVTVDDTYIYVNYKTAPPSGTDNVVLWWEAEV